MLRQLAQQEGAQALLALVVRYGKGSLGPVGADDRIHGVSDDAIFVSRNGQEAEDVGWIGLREALGRVVEKFVIDAPAESETARVRGETA